MFHVRGVYSSSSFFFFLVLQCFLRGRVIGLFFKKLLVNANVFEARDRITTVDG